MNSEHHSRFLRKTKITPENLVITDKEPNHGEDEIGIVGIEVDPGLSLIRKLKFFDDLKNLHDDHYSPNYIVAFRYRVTGICGKLSQGRSRGGVFQILFTFNDWSYSSIACMHFSLW